MIRQMSLCHSTSFNSFTQVFVLNSALMRFQILKVMGHKFLKSSHLELRDSRINLSQHILISDLKLIKKKLKIKKMLKMEQVMQIKTKKFKVV